VHSLSEVLSSCTILDGGVNPFPRYWEKTSFAVDLAQNVNFGYT